MPVTELYAFNLICENLLAALYGVALNKTTPNNRMSAYDLKLEDNAVKNIDAVYHHQLYTPSFLFFRSHCLWVCIFNIPLFYEK